MKSRVVPVVWLFVVLGVLPFAARSEVRITEFMASNSNTLADEDGDFEDWIELHNAGAETVNLAGWFLTDNAGDPMQWQFPEIELAPDDSLLIFASGKDRRTPGAPLHANFRISIDGEYLALLDPELNVHSGFIPQFPAQVRDVSFGIGTLKETQSLVAAGSPARLFIPRDQSLGLDWIQPDFDGVGWSTSTAAIGYENAPADYAGLILTDLTRHMSGVNGSCHLRVPFVIESLSELSNFRLRVRYDDGFVGWLNGEEIGRRNAPDVLAWNSFALADHPDAEAVEPDVFPLTPFLDRLVVGTNWLAFQGLNVSLSSSDFLLTVELEADRVVEERSGWRYFQTPTPGEPNAGGDISVGPVLHSAAHQPNVPAAADPLQVTVEVAAGLAPVGSVSLHYRVMFGGEITVTMFDDGAHGDGAAGDGVYGAMIPGGAGSPGQLIRYRITATDVAGDSSRLPLFHDPLDSGEYFGTVVHNPQIQSELPVVQLFVSNVAASETRSGTRASLFYLDELYDNIEITLRGQSTSGFPKKGHNLDFNRDHRFRPRPDLGRVKDIKLLTNWADKSRVRNTLAYEVIEWAGSVGHFGFPVRVQRNGAFHAILDLLEDGDDRWMERVGRDPEGALYKMYNALNGARGNEKKTRRDEDFSDLQALVNELSTSRPLADRVRYAWDNLDLPQTISYFAACALISSQDHGHKNYYVYRDTRGSGEWTILPWDVDLSFGRNWTHEFSYLHDALYQDNELDFYNAPQQNKPANRLYDLIFEHPEFRAMYLRRLRTLMDTILQPPGTAEEELLIEARIREWVELLDPPGISPSDTDLDYSRWGSWGNQNSTRAEAQRIIDIHLPGRREFLFQDPLATVNGESIPSAQPDTVQVGIDSHELHPSSGNTDEAWIRILNQESFAVDLSGWKLTGGVEFTFRPGTVLPGNRAIHVSPDVAAFRARASGPRGGQNLFVQGDAWHRVGNQDGVLTLSAPDGTVADTLAYTGDPSDAQRHLRITELMFSPALHPSGTDAEDFEFVELKNVGPVPLDLNGVRFTDGIRFEFSQDAVLEPGAFALMVHNLTGFTARYGDHPPVFGVYDGRLDNSGEMVRLADAADDPILEFAYDPAWQSSASGQGYSLVIVDEHVPWHDWGLASRWRASTAFGGSPGYDDPQDPDGDSDGDGMPDAWEMGHGLDPMADDAGVDTDGNGLTNLEEYLAGTDPRWAASTVRLEFEVVAGEGVRLSFEVHPGRQYRLLHAPAPNGDTWEELFALPPSEEKGTHTVTVAPDDVPARYYRLETFGFR